MMVSGTRERLARVLHRAGLLGAVMRVRSRWGASLSVLTYHSVADRAYPGLDDGVVDATPAQFDEQLAFVKRWFTVVGIDEVARAAEGDEPLPPCALMITFDDGYRSCYETALPILQRHGLRAVFFIATGYIDQRRLYWWDRISYLVHHARRRRISLSYPHPLDIDLDAPPGRGLSQLLDAVKLTRGLDLERFLGELADATGAPWDDQIERQLADEVLMTWDQVRALRAAGMDVQSHTRHHRVLQTLDERALREELSGSRADLERELGEPVRAVAYPVGRSVADDPAIRAALHEAGYELGFSNQSGVNHRWRRADRFDVRRLSVDRALSTEMFQASLAIPPLAFVRE